MLSRHSHSASPLRTGSRPRGLPAASPRRGGRRDAPSAGPVRLRSGGARPRARRALVGRPPPARARPELSRRADRASRPALGSSLRARRAGHRSPCGRRRRCAVSTASRCASGCCSSFRSAARRLRARCSSSGRARSPREGPRPDSTSEAGSHGGASTSSSTRAAPGAIVGRRGGIGGVGDRLRTADRERSRARDVGRAALARPRGRARRRRGNRSGAPRRVQGLWPLPPPGRLGPEHRVHRVRGARSCVRGGPRARRRAHLAIVAILAYALAVGWQPSVVRAAVAGCLASVAWLLSRPSDRWHTMALGRWCCSPGRRGRCSSRASSSRSSPSRRSSSRCRACGAGRRAIRCRLRSSRWSASRSACGIATAPILWLQFGTIPLWTVPANALAEPAMPVLLGCGLGAALLAPVIPDGRGLALLARRSRGRLDRVRRPARRVAPVRPDVVPDARPRARAAVLGAGVALRALPRYRRRRRGRHHGRPGRCCALGWWALHPPPSWSPPAGLRVSFLDVGQGRRNPARDARREHSRRYGPARGTGRPATRRMGLRRLAALVISHAHRRSCRRSSCDPAPAGGRPRDRPPAAGSRLDERSMRRTAVGSAFRSSRPT